MTRSVSLKTLTAASLLAAVAAVGPAWAADVTIRLAHLNPADPFESHSGAMAATFKSLVETASGGEIAVEVYPNGQLGKDNEVIQQVRDGIVQATISSAGGVAQHYPLVGVFDIPFAFPNIAVSNRVMDLSSEFGQTFAADLEEATGTKVLGLLDSGGFFAFTNSKRPIETVADMDGLRIRTMTLPTHQAMVDSLGAQPTPLPWAEVYTALQTGVADGQMNPIPVIAFANFDEVQQYLSITNHVITPYLWLMNGAFYADLSERHQDIVDWAAEVSVEAGRGVSRVIEASERGLPKLASNMEVNAVSPEEQAKFAAAAQPAVRALIEEQYGEAGVAMLEAMLAEIETARTELGLAD
ncbi:DctP family TRAP transporter solute-binding subunit [Roseospira visakhapatnamensis]|uniref:Tripartite ATP-independent transporter DctP family solute receptor n=1 Tax=Roseospira visakhapatnamensis TaxID=390880 RepID=A0A7W6RG72_9PROT|nr:DctP family TRAP transporter solute-binding subunit [Roseospira visakhapatnamensis]MBB4267750.1 tripartite ATP-independent transporter DctP family solute receptor [Roseospira visakhapatnamensis]